MPTAIYIPATACHALINVKSCHKRITATSAKLAVPRVDFAASAALNIYGVCRRAYVTAAVATGVGRRSPIGYMLYECAG